MQIIRPEPIYATSQRSFWRVNSGDWKDLNLIKGEKGAEFGGHYHKETVELFYVIKGDLALSINGATPIWLGEDEGLIIEPNELHKIKCISQTVFLTALSKPFNEKQPDNYDE